MLFVQESLWPPMPMVLTSSSGPGTLLFLYGFKEGLCWPGFLGGAILKICIMCCDNFF